MQVRYRPPLSSCCNSEVITSFPHNLVLDSQPRFGLTPSEFLNLYNFLINKRIFMKLVAKCSAFASLTYQVYVKFCNHIPLRFRLDSEAKWPYVFKNYE